MQAIILAAGISTRLRPLTDAVPKPMLPVMGRPMMEHIVRQLVASGLSDIIVTTHYHPEKISEHFADGSAFDARISYAHEDILMNTAGSLKRLEGIVRDTFIVIGGNDFLPRLDVRDFINFHHERAGVGTIAFKRLTNPTLLPFFGQGLLDDQCALTEFREKPLHNVSDLIHTTYQIYHPRALSLIPPGMPCSIPDYLIHRILRSAEKIYGYVTDSPFICISTKDQYQAADNQLAEALGWERKVPT